MDIKLTTGVIIGMVLSIIILLLLIFLVFYAFVIRKKKQTNKEVSIKKQRKKKQEDTSLIALKRIIKKQTSSAKELSSALDLVIKKYGDISKQPTGKKGTSFDVYIDILFIICRHPNTNKDIIIKFESALSKKNPTFALSIHDAITQALDSRSRS